MSRGASDEILPPPIRKRGVVAVIIRGEQFLVIRRSQHVRAPGMYCFPGGGIEPGETEEEALVRELFEELAVAARPIRRLTESLTPWQVHLAWWLAEIEPHAALTPQPHEVESFHWFSAAEIRGLPNLLASNIEFLDAWTNGLYKNGDEAITE
jgi:8-oxo-dGTP pyrophosphatase MutT (NUDIX family)